MDEKNCCKHRNILVSWSDAIYSKSEHLKGDCNSSSEHLVESWVPLDFVSQSSTKAVETQVYMVRSCRAISQSQNV